MAPVSKGKEKKEPRSSALAGLQRLWRTVGPVIPCRVASQQHGSPDRPHVGKELALRDLM
jgi:hypothetical protein